MSNTLTEKFVDVSQTVIDTLVSILGADRVFTGERTEKFSKDFYWYSPVLKALLEDKRASVALRVLSKEELIAVARVLYENDIPVVVRGGGSGNYGQAIPLYGGAVIDVSGMNKIFSVEGVVHAEAGASMRDIELKAREAGWELRCMPSTWAMSSIGGFLCGGSGGIGSISYGGIAFGDNVKSVTLLSMEAEPRLIKFEERESIKALHTYGTTGVMVEVEMRLGLARDYDQLIFVHDDWHHLLDWTYAVASDDSIPKRLVTQFEKEIPAYFKPLRKYIPEGLQTTFLMVDSSVTDQVIADAAGKGIQHVYTKPFGNPPKPPFITDYTWNHTTLWAIKADPQITYLQAGFGEDFSKQIDLLKARYGDEILMHLEMVLGNPKFETNAPGIAVGSIPLIRYSTEERLNEMIAYCAEIGVGIANPHTCVLEEGGRHPDIKIKHKLKSEVDPKALLNPGKMKSYPVNPFARTA